MIIIATCRERRGTHTHTCGSDTQRQTDRDNKRKYRRRLILIPTPSLTVNHSSSTRPPPLPPTPRGYQAGAEGLSPADSRSSGSGEWSTVVGGGGSGALPRSLRYGGQGLVGAGWRLPHVGLTRSLSERVLLLSDNQNSRSS